MELLTGCKIHNIDDAWKCTEWFHSRHVHTVVVSSSDLGDKDIILMLGSQNKGNCKYKALKEDLSFIHSLFF